MSDLSDRKHILLSGRSPKEPMYHYVHPMKSAHTHMQRTQATLRQEHSTRRYGMAWDDEYHTIEEPAQVDRDERYGRVFGPFYTFAFGFVLLVVVLMMLRIV